MDNIEKAQLRELRIAVLHIADILTQLSNWAPYGDPMPTEHQKLLMAIREKIKQLP